MKIPRIIMGNPLNSSLDGNYVPLNGPLCKEGKSVLGFLAMGLDKDNNFII
ncbi:hypothetical protein V5097_03780 [Arenibacter palladensis]|uniref:hypothetical protein n=1 Tax=Arenibacter palladensis TaxID=237373 RepID=UPI002FD3B9AA